LYLFILDSERIDKCIGFTIANFFCLSCGAIKMFFLQLQEYFLENKLGLVDT